MKPFRKITFNTFTNTKDIARVLYKGVYVGRVILNDDKLFEYEEKGRALKYHISNPEHKTLEDVKAFVTKRILRQEKDKLKMLPLTIDGLTPLGVAFMKKFINNAVILNKELSSEHKNVANFFVTEQLLQKVTLTDGRVAFHLKKPVYEMIEKL